MLIHEVSALVFTLANSLVILFQLALIGGKPWGEYAMGGKFPGEIPNRIKLVYGIQILVLILIDWIVLVKADLICPKYFELSQSAIWIVVGIMSISTFLNLITPSKKEKQIWAPISLIMLICVIIIIAYA